VTDAELEDLVRRFNACNVPRPEWTHAAHLAVGLWHVSQYGRRDALVRLRAGITRLNEQWRRQLADGVLRGEFGLGRTRPRAAALGNNPRAPGSHV
jgi:hypothetical protein